MSHFKMVIFLADWFDFQLSFYSLIIVHQLAMFLLIYRPMYKTYLFIVNGADLDYTKKKTFKIAWWMIIGMY